MSSFTSKEIGEHLKSLKVDGVSNIVRSSFLLVSLVWIVLLLANALICVLLIKDTIVQYCKYEVSTTIRYLNEQRSPLPTITICSVNALSSDFSVQMIQQANISFRDMTGLGTVNGNFKVYIELEAYLNSTRGYLMTDDEKRDLSRLDAFMYSCAFEEEPCNATDFEFIFHPLYLGCYRFNADGRTMMSMTGTTTELSLQFYVGLPDYLLATYARGVYVFVQNSTDYPFNYAESPYMMSSGTGMTIIPQRQFFTQLAAPYSDCNVREDNELANERLLLDRELFEAVIETKYAYSQKTCVSFCEQKRLAEECSCVSFKSRYLMPNVSAASTPSYGFCLSASELNCSNQFAKKFMTGSFIGDNCLSKCPLECTQRLMSPSIVTYTFPSSPAYVTFVQSLASLTSRFSTQKDFKSLSNYLVQITVHYDNLAFVQVEEEEKMTMEDMVGILGGHLHLFLGMSLLSFVELVECAALFVFSFGKAKAKVDHKPGKESHLSPPNDPQSSHEKL